MSADASTGVVSRVPASWRFAYAWQQVVVLLLMGPSFLLALSGSAVFDAAFSALPSFGTPVGLVLAPGVYLPFLAPLALGVPLALSRYRAPLLLWLGIIVVALALSVFELSRLNWFAFFSGVAFRVDGGPVPVVRTLAGLVTLLLALLVLAQQSLRRTVADLASRGVAIADLRNVRDGLVGLERGILALAAGAGVVLTVVAGVSLSLTEGAPEAGSGLAVPLGWAVVLLLALLGAIGVALWDSRRRTGGR